MLDLETCIKANKTRHYTGVGVLIVTKYLNKPCIVLGLENNKTKKITEKLIEKMINSNESVNDAKEKVINLEASDSKFNKKDKLINNIYIYEEFGGGIQDNNLTLEENACFELCEETSNLLNFTNPFVLNKGINTFFDIPYLKDRIYRLYVVYIEDFTKDIHLFYKNKQVLKSNVSTYFKYRNFTEVSEITFLELDNINKYIDNYNNYLTINSEEMLYNQINKDKGINKYKGILRCIDNIYLSKRLVDFLNMNFIYDKKLKGYIYYADTIDEKINKEMYNKFGKNIKNYKPHFIRGIDFCKYIFKQTNNDASCYINLTKPRKNNKGSVKYNFLNHTYSIDAF